MQRLAAMTPSAPAGWKVEAPPVYPLGASTCRGVTFSQFSYTVTYTNLTQVQDSSRRAEEMGKEIAELRRIPEEKAAEMAELGRQSRALQRQRPQVRAGGDKAAMEALEAQIRELDKRWTAIKRAHEESVQPKILEISRKYLASAEGHSPVVRVTVETKGGKDTLHAEGDKALAAEIVKLWKLGAS